MSDIKALLESITGESAESEGRANDAKLKAFAWARVSTEEQEKRGLSIPQQLKEIREYADRRDIEVVREFQEAASAFSRNGKRPEFDRMIDKAKANPDINVILVHDFSRFSRDSVKGRGLFRELRETGIKVLSVNDPDFDPDTESGVWTEACTFAKNEAHSRTIAMHVRKGCKANIRMRDPKSGWCFKNGGMALWGYRLEHIQNGIGKGGMPIYKGIWLLDETVIAGKPLHEWVRYCLIELAMKGASIVKLRDFCNEMGIPCRRDKVWNSTSWKDLLYDFNLLKYAGFGIWNVRGPGTRRKPIGEWEIVENAHPSIITEEEAIVIIKARRGLRDKYGGPPRGRARKSNYLLTGGIAVCDRCGKNLVGHKDYYVCGSEPYRGGRGCGPGVYVPQLLLDETVIIDIKGIIAKLSDPVGFTRMVNEELRQAWEMESGYDPQAEKRIAEIDRKVDHLRKLLEDGLDDVDYANSRLRELRTERDSLSEALTKPGQPLQVDSQKATSYRKNLHEVLQQGKPEERKECVQPWVDKITLFPESRELEIKYSIPDQITNFPIMNRNSPAIHLPGLTNFWRDLFRMNPGKGNAGLRGSTF
jgi:site-specific DNA recombinase